MVQDPAYVVKLLSTSAHVCNAPPGQRQLHRLPVSKMRIPVGCLRRLRRQGTFGGNAREGPWSERNGYRWRQPLLWRPSALQSALVLLHVARLLLLSRLPPPALAQAFEARFCVHYNRSLWQRPPPQPADTGNDGNECGLRAGYEQDHLASVRIVARPEREWCRLRLVERMSGSG